MALQEETALIAIASDIVAFVVLPTRPKPVDATSAGLVVVRAAAALVCKADTTLVITVPRFLQVRRGEGSSDLSRMRAEEPIHGQE